MIVIFLAFMRNLQLTPLELLWWSGAVEVLALFMTSKRSERTIHFVFWYMVPVPHRCLYVEIYLLIILFLVTIYFQYVHDYLALNGRGPSYLSYTRSMSWLLMTWRRKEDIDYIAYVGPSLTWGGILSTCAISMWMHDTKCKYVLMFPLKNLARKG